MKHASGQLSLIEVVDFVSRFCGRNGRCVSSLRTSRGKSLFSHDL